MLPNVQHESEHDAMLDVFRYVNAEKAAFYRAIMQCFVEAKLRFAIHMKPEEITEALRKRTLSGQTPLEQTEVETALTQLKEWGNLKAHADSSEVRTVTDFMRAHLLYQLSAEGEAAERALEFYREQIEQPGELQTVALADIESLLSELADLLSKPELDVQKVHVSCTALYARFDGLAARARQFMGSVQRAIDLQEGDVQAFLAYKEKLIEYLERFIGELIVKSPRIASLIREVEKVGMSQALEAVVARDVSDVLDTQSAAEARIRSEWTLKWEGLRAWFFGSTGEPSQAERLRSRARSAIPDLLAVVADLNARRVRRSDRAEDFRTLAHWFAECNTDAEAHILWRSAFCLSPSRHLTIDAQTLARRDEAPVSPRTSWLDADPLLISPHLRAVGRVRSFGRQPAIVDDSDAKTLLGQTLAEEQRQFEAARRIIATDGPIHLSDFAELEHDSLELFLDCLGAALAAQGEPDHPVGTTSSDGSLRIRLEPIPDAAWVCLQTHEGALHGRDCRIHIEEAFQDTEAEEPTPA
jgi:uncharacterized protein (TIGR02677 family)